MRRVVITGLGMVTPLGCGVETTWRRLTAGQSGAARIEAFDVSDLACKIGCVIPRGDGSDGTFNPDQWMDPKDQRKVDPFIVYSMAAAREALDDAGWKPASYEDQTRTGVLVGSGIGGIGGIYDASITLAEKGPRRVSPFFIPGRLINLASGYISIEFGLKGPNHAVVTACSTGAHAIGDAARLIGLDDADVMVAGGTESPLNRLSIAGFAACRALSTGFNDEPTRASRPYDRDRDGFVMGEGAGLVVLEEYEHAKARGAKIYAEVVGYGLSGDAYPHHLAGGRRRRGLSLHEGGPRTGRHGAFGHRLHQRPRHLDAARRRARAQGGRASGRQRGSQARHVVDEIGRRPPARRRRRSGSDLLGPRHSRPGGAADPQSRQSVRGDGHRPRSPRGEAAFHRGGPVQFLRLRRHQRLACAAGRLSEAEPHPVLPQCLGTNPTLSGTSKPFAGRERQAS